MSVPLRLLALLLSQTFLAMGAPAAGSCEWKKKYRSQNLIQVLVPQSDSTTVTDLFLTHSTENMDAVANSAITAVFDAYPTSKSYLSRDEFRMMNPVFYSAADGSLRVLARVTLQHYCGCVNPRKLCKTKYYDSDRLLHGKRVDDVVSCLADGTDGCIVIGEHSKTYQQANNGFADPHAFQVQGHPWAFVAQGTWDSCTPVLLNLNSLEYSILTLPGMTDCEKNWQGFEHNGEMHFTHWLFPNHAVIRCSASNASCEHVSNTSSTFSLDGLPAFVKQKNLPLHGSTPYVELDSDHLLAAAHVHTDLSQQLGRYWHSFYAIQRKPPFAVVANTRWFQFAAPAGWEDAEWTQIQFAGGLLRSGDDLRISYAVGDCVSQALNLKVSEVAEALGLKND